MELEQLGLRSDEATVYRLMLEHPRASKEEFAELLGWSLARIDAAFAELSRLALVRPSAEEPGGHRLVRPEVGLASLLLRQEEEVLERQRQIAASKLLVSKLLASIDDSSLTTGHGPKEISGLDEVLTKIEQLSRSSTQEISLFAPGGAQIPENMDAARPLDRDALERGVRLRYVYLDSIRNDPPTSAYVQWLVEQGGEVRTVPYLPPRMIIYDRRLAVVPIDPQRVEAGALILDRAGAVAHMVSLFEQVWQSGQPFGTQPSRDDDGLNGQERAVLQLLSAGHTDEVVARKLGVSVRTCRRITSQLMERLDARSRFQAGVLAMSRGWLEPREEG
jgi:sugar-specific transcriptional regulator TrmB/DNA-binding CsgD family transcriptional regulator